MQPRNVTRLEEQQGHTASRDVSVTRYDPDMARRKNTDDPTKRFEWQISVTLVEQAAIKAAAAGRQLGPFIAEAVTKSQVVPRSDWTDGVDRLARIEAILEELRQAVLAMPEPLDRIEGLALLVRAEQSVTAVASPWSRAEVTGE